MNRWQQIERLYQAALEREPKERSAFLDQACSGDNEVRHEVESLLALEQPAANFIEAPALQAAIKKIAREEPPSLLGQQLGSYKILSLLGAGGMGEVYRARDSRLDRDVALKVVPELFAQDVGLMSRFQREARVLASLNHPHIAAIYGLEESNDVRALVMELVEGPTLAERIAQGPILVDQALPIARQMAEALESPMEE